MLHFNINLTSLAIILWSGMLIVAGSIWVLSAQVRKVADLLEDHSKRTTPDARLSESARPAVAVRVPRAAARRSLPAPSRRVIRSGMMESRKLIS